MSTLIRALALLLVAAGTAYTADVFKHASTSPAAPQPSSPSGALDFQTDTFTGRFQYRFPIRVAPARNGSEPEISLIYDSGSGNGFCGAGWTLDLGTIQRETRYGAPFLWQNGVATSYDNSKGFVCSFQGVNGRLVSIGGAEYRAASDREFLTFTAGESDGWVVYDKSGTKFTFLPGLINPRVQPTVDPFDATFLWNLEQVETADGNLTRIDYFKHQEQRYPLKISYNGHTDSFPCTHSVEFVWEDRARDTNISYAAGFRVTTIKRLKEIVVKVGQNQVRKYLLGYTISPCTFRSLLTRIDEQGSDATATMPPVTFEYQEKETGFADPTPWPNLSLPAEDYDKLEVVGLPDKNYGWYRKFLDIDGDALPDSIARAGDNRFIVRPNRTGGMAGFGGLHDQTLSWAPIFDTPPAETAPRSPVFMHWDGPDSYVTTIIDLLDINGDGYLDRVSRASLTSPFTNFAVRLGTGLGFDSVVKWGGVYNPPADSTWLPRWACPTASDYADENAKTFTALTDMNGDGLPDRVLRKFVPDYVHFEVQLNNGWNFDPPLIWTNVQKGSGWQEGYYRSIASPRLALIDLNGDGLPDRVLRKPSSPFAVWRVQFNNGAGFDPLEDWGELETGNGISESQANPDWLIDINCDGLPDKLFQDVEKVQLNTGSGFAIRRQITIDTGEVFSRPPVFRDVNGDGILDFVHDDVSDNGPDKIRLGKGPYPDLLKAVRNNIGGSIEITYRPSTHYDNRDRAWTGDPWAAGAKALLPYVVQTVASVTVNGGLDGPQTTTYTYANGFHDAATREFRGFARSEVTDPLGTKTITWFHQGGGRDFAAEGEFQDANSDAKKGMPFCIEAWGSDQKIYSRTLNKVEETVLHQNGWVFPYISQTITTDFDPKPAGQELLYSRSRAKLFQYNTSTGNLIKESDLGEVTNVVAASHSFVDVPADSVFAHTTYYSGLPNNPHIIDRPQSVRATADSAGTQKLSERRFIYHPQTGAPLTNQVWINPGDRFANVSVLTYNQYGNVSRSVDAAGIATDIAYDANQVFPQSQTTANYAVSSQTIDPRSGLPLLVTDMKGLVTRYTYDKLYRLTDRHISVAPYQAANLWKESFAYVLGGISNAQSFNCVSNRVNDATDSVGHIAAVYSDGLGRTIRTATEAEPDSAGNARRRVVDTYYDARGKTEYQSRPYFATLTNPGQRDPSKPHTQTQYDPVGRPSIITPPPGDADSPTGPSTTVYREGTNPWAVVSTDAKNATKVSRMDAHGRVVQIIEPENAETAYGYDKLGNLIIVVDAQFNQTQIDYDSLGRKIALYDPDMGLWQYFYDDAGRLTMQLDPRGTRIDYVYSLDVLGRLTDKYLYTWNPVIGDWEITDLVHYDNDVSDDPAFTVYPGQQYRIWDNPGTERFSYDVRGRVLKKERYFYGTGETFLTQYTYDDADRVSTVTYPGNIAQVKYSYDTATHLKKVEALSSPFGPQVFYEATAFTDHDEVAAIKWRNNSQTTTTYEYYPASRRLKKIRTTRAGEVPIQDLSYKYDAVDNVTNIADAVNPAGNASDSLQNITYDNLHRLKSYARDGQTTTFNYDNIGNLTLNQEMGSGPYAYPVDILPHAVSSANGRVYSYDNAGNMTSRHGLPLGYDEENRLRHVNFVFYLYNDGGERVRKISFAGETVWIDDIYEREPGRTLCHVEADGKRIVTFSADGSEIYYYHSDHLGSSSLMTDQNGSLVRQQYGYRAFGSERFALSLDIQLSFTSRFTGQSFDAETGLYYYQSRYYDPELGRFIQPDSIVPDPGSSQSLNRYSYVLNNPLKYVDPTGHAEQKASFFGGSGTPGFGSAHDWLMGNGGGSLGFGTGRDWLGLGWGAGGYRTSELPLGFADPYALWDDTPGPIRGGNRSSLTYAEKWKYLPWQAADETATTVASVASMALPFGAPVRIARVAAAARIGLRFGITRMEPLLAKSVWSLGPGPRGLAIEARLGGNLPSGFPVIDRFANGVATSIKSVDLAAPSYQNTAKLARTLDKHVDAVAGFNGARRAGQVINASQITARQLQLAIPKGGASVAQQAVIDAAAARAKSMGVNFIVTPVP